MAFTEASSPNPISSTPLEEARRSRRINWGIMLPVLLIVIVGGILLVKYLRRDATPATPFETLDALEKVSMPIVISEQARTTQLDDLSRKSTPSDLTVEERLQILKQLE
jgi:hypothetical protein